jgi:hypothetical protein
MRSTDLGFPTFVVPLMVLLPMMLIAVIRLPEWQGSSEEDARAQPLTAAPRMRRPGPRQRWPSRGNAAGQEGARIAAGENSPMPIPRRHETARRGCCLPGAGS